MTRFKILISETAQAALADLESAIAERIKIGLRELENDPFRPRPKADIKKLHGFGGQSIFRLRIGDFRAIYFVIADAVKVTEIIRRGKGYEWLD